MTINHDTREAWLVDAVEALSLKVFGKVGYVVPNVRVSVGFPVGRGKTRSVLGQCWHPDAAEDKAPHIFINPTLTDGLRVLDVLAHELVHAIDKGEHGHTGAFRTMATAIGLTGKMTATVAGPLLRDELAEVLAMIGDYPHAALTPSEATTTKQSTRMLLSECPEGSGYKVRLTAKWLKEYGAPFCPCHNERMTGAPTEGE